MSPSSRPFTALALGIFCAWLALAPEAALAQRQPVNRADLLLRAARNQVRAKRYEKGLKYFEEYLELHPKDVAVEIETCGALLQLDRLDESAKRLVSIVKEHPGNSAAVKQLASTYNRQKDWDKAAKLLEVAVKRFDDNAVLRTQLAEVYTWDERYDDAVRQYRILLAQNPRNLTLKHTILQVLLWGGKHKEYLAESARYLQDVPHDISIRMARMDIYASQRDFAAAAQECRAILTIKPKHQQARFRLAQYLTWLGEHENAIKEFMVALEQNPKDLRLRREYGRLLLWANRHDEAIQTFRQLHSELPKDEAVTRDYLLAIAGVDKVADKEKEWLEAFYAKSYPGKKPLQAGTLAGLARALRNIDKQAEALKVFEAAVKALPNDLSLRLQYADLLSAMGYAEKAEAEYQRLLESVGKVKPE
jgi:tetratricopeptide (TPR) repeat protein